MVARWSRVLVIAGFLGVVSPAWGDIITSLGTKDTTHNDPTVRLNPGDLSLPSGPVPFDGTVDGSSDFDTNFTANWTMAYVVPPATTIFGGTFYLQIYDADVCTTAPRNPVASFTIDGFDYTAALNTAFKADPCSVTDTDRTGNVNKELLTLTDGGLFSALHTSPASFHLALADTGRSLFGDTSKNGAMLLYAELNLTTQAPSTVPEPGSWALLASGIAAIAGRRFLVRRG